jgi:hypothetical protein
VFCDKKLLSDKNLFLYQKKKGLNFISLLFVHNCVSMPFMLAICVSHALLLLSNIFNDFFSLLVLGFCIGALCMDK